MFRASFGGRTRLLPVTEVYEYTSATWRRGILNMSRGTKSKIVPGEKGCPSQDESGSGGMKIVDLFWMLRPTLMHTKNLYDNGPNPFFFGLFQSYGYENGPDSYGQIRLSFS